jgi:hypothetical protein
MLQKSLFSVPEHHRQGIHFIHGKAQFARAKMSKRSLSQTHHQGSQIHLPQLWRERLAWGTLNASLICGVCYEDIDGDIWLMLRGPSEKD